MGRLAAVSPNNVGPEAQPKPIYSLQKNGGKIGILRFELPVTTINNMQSLNYHDSMDPFHSLIDFFPNTEHPSNNNKK